MFSEFLNMKRLLLPLIVAFALPTAVEAELVYLECYFPKQKSQTVFSKSKFARHSLTFKHT